jgi:hypothetical protein
MVATPAPAAATPLDATTSRRIAWQALAVLFRRANPELPLPRSLDARDIALVEACTESCTWDAATLEQLHLDAIEGALVRTTMQPPTARFIWGRLDQFLAHARHGRSLRLAPKPPPRAKRRVAAETPATCPQIVEAATAIIARLDAISDDPPKRRGLRRLNEDPPHDT